MKYKKVLAVIIASILLCAVGIYIVYASTVVNIKEDELYKVVYVLDGDSIKAKVDKHIITLRLLGIDTPETIDPRKPNQCYGKVASDETKLLLTGREIRLKLNPDREEKDKYGRYLAYVYRDDGLFINEYLLENGFAREYTYGSNYLYRDDFKKIEQVAKNKNIGLWSECTNKKK